LPTISQARNKGERNPLQKFSLPLENVLDIVQNFGPLSQSSLHPGVPSWLRALLLLQSRGGQTAACETHATRQHVLCGSSS